MKTHIVTLLTLVAVQSQASKFKRNTLHGAYSQWRGSHIPLQNTGVDSFLPLQVVGTGDTFNLKVDLPPPPPPAVAIVSNSIEKPVMESQEYFPPQSGGAVILPQMRQPATPVNAAGSNVLANQGAVYLGSGSLGVVNLGGGAYALGSGSIGYSGNRAQPRPSGMVPVYPPLPANPTLIPAAVPSPVPAQPLPPVIQISNSLDYGTGQFGVPQAPQYDQNGYEYLRPDRVGFGMALPPRPPRVRQQFATPTLQVQPQVPQSLPPLSYNYGITLGQPSGGGVAALG